MSGLDAWVREKFSLVELTDEHLHDYQDVAVDFLDANPFSALFLDTGLGKTASLLKLIYRLVLRGEAGNTLVIAPKRVAEVTWPDEIATWEFAAPLTYTIIRDDVLIEAVNRAGQLARRQAKLDEADIRLIAEEKAAKHRRKAERKGQLTPEQLDQLYIESVKNFTKAEIDLRVSTARIKAARLAVRQMMFDRPATIFLIHKEQVEFLVDAFERDWPFRTVIIDESSSLKDHRTGRWKALWKVRPLMKRMHQLTATPTAEGYRYLFAQITLLDRGERLGTDSSKFESRYFTQNRYTHRWEIREGAEEEITAKIADICLVMKQEDYLDLQQPVVSPHKVHLSPGQMTLYKKMEDDFVVELPDGTEVEAETAAALSQKLLQMASGVLYDTILEEQPDGTFKKRRAVHHLHDEKIDALRQLEEELNGETMLVAYYHQSSLDRILKAFPHAKAMDKEGKLIKEWNKGKIQMFLIHPQSDAHGLNLQKGGRHVVFFDLPFSYEQYYQLYRRLARQGQELLVIIHQLIAVGTRDEDVVDCLNNKRDTQEVFFKLITALRRKAKRRLRQQHVEGL